MFLTPTLVSHKGASATPPLSLSYVTAGTSNNDSGYIDIPSAAAEGDLAVLMDRARVNPTYRVPTGFTVLLDDTSANAHFICSYKLLESGDPGSTIQGMAKSYYEASKVMLIYRPSGGAISSVVIQDAGIEITNSDPEDKTIHASAGSATTIIAIAACAWNNQSNSDFDINSYPLNGPIQSGGEMAGYEYLWNGSGADCTVGMSNHGNLNTLFGAYLEVS